MTDNEIIKALENCRSVDIGECRDCPYKYDSNCINELESDALALIDRLRPCKIGDTVFAIRNYHSTKKITSGTVSEMYFVGREMDLCIVVKNVSRGRWGKDVFPSYEEAEKHLKGCERHEN